MAVTDVALQTEWMSYGKCCTSPVVVTEIPWYFPMGAHSMVNGCGVWLVTGNAYLGLAESILHFIIDYCKCKFIIGVNLDILFHIICRVIYAVIFYLFIK